MARLIIAGSLGRRIARSPVLHRLMWRLEAAVLWTFWLVSRALGPDRGARFGEGLLRWLGPRQRKARHVRRNLEVAHGTERHDIDTLSGDVWGNLGRVLAEYPHLDRICETEFDRRMEVVIGFDRDALAGNGRPKVFAGAHLANWEVASAAVRHAGFSCTVIFSPQQNPFVDGMLQHKRRALRCELVAKRDSMRVLARELRAGRNVGFVIDQRVDDGDTIRFFGVDAPTTIAPARLALRYGADIIPVRIERLEDGRYRVSLLAPLQPDPSLTDKRDQAKEMTAQLYRLFEAWIKERPGQWHCLKHRWPKPRLANDDGGNVRRAEGA